MMMKRYLAVYHIIFLLTVLDVVFTAVGLKLGVIIEANPIINYFIGISMELTFFCVLAYVAAALLLMYKVSPRIHWLNSAVAGLAAIKLYTVILHIRWIKAYLYILG